MSSTGVRDTNSNEKRIIKGLILNEAQFIQSLRVFANSSSLSGLGATGGDSNNSPLEASGNYFTKSGDILLGQFGNSYDAIYATNLVDDTLNVSKSTGITFPVVILQGEGLADDDLVTITEGTDVFPFQELWIRTRANIITVKNSGNVNTPNGNDLVLPVGSIIKLIFDNFLGEWVIVGGNLPDVAQDPIIVNEKNIGQVGLQSVSIDWSEANFHRMVVGGDITVVMNNLPDVGKWEKVVIEFTQDAIGGHLVTFTNTFINNIIPVVDTGIDAVTSIEFYAYGLTPTTHAIVAFVTSGAFNGVADPVYMIAKMSLNQDDPVADDVVDFDSVTEGSGLILTNGVVSGFVPGHIYECYASLGISGTTGRISYQFFEDTDSPQLIGVRGIGIAVDSIGGQSNQSTASAIFSPTDETDTLELRVINTNIATNDILAGSSDTTPMSVLKIIDITGYVGGSGTTISFPKILINDVMTVSGVTGTLNIDLAISQHWVLELVGDVTLTFTNPPVSNDTSEQIVLEFIQDIIGGRIVTYSDLISPIDPPVVTTAQSREVITGFSRRTNGGIILYNLYLVGN